MSTELSIREEQPVVGLSLIEGPDPATAVVYARKVSAAIAGVLEEDNGFKTIQGKKHITIEGWQTLAAMTGHTVRVEWSRIVPGLANARGVETWEARAVVRDQTGREVAAGESMADPNEPGADKKWARGGNFSVRSMAQTRAMSRALSSRMRYIVQLAGFSGTPAEEMGGDNHRETSREIARRRYKVLRDEVKVDHATLDRELGDHGPELADDYFFAALAYNLGFIANPQDDETVEGEVADDEQDADAAWEASGEQTIPGTEAPSSHPMDPEDA